MVGLFSYPPLSVEEDLGYGPLSPTQTRRSVTQVAGLRGLEPSAVDTAALGERPTRGTPLLAPGKMPEVNYEETATQAVERIQALPSQLVGPQVPAQRPSRVLAFSPSTNKIFVNGFLFDPEDAQSALESVNYLNAPAAPAPGDVAMDWEPLNEGLYSQFIESIRKPSLGTRFSKSFELGAEGLKGLVGAGLQFAGAEETGSQIVLGAEERQRQLSPYQVSIEKVTAGELGAIEYAVSILGQQGPNILESIGVGLVGAVGGSATSGNPLGGALVGLGSMLSKGAIKTAAKDAAEAYARGVASTQQKKLLARIGGAAAATTLSNYAMGTAETYQEMRQQGADPSDMSARAVAAATGIPFAVLDSIPEYLAAARLFGLAGAKGGLLRRGLTGAGVGAATEGLTETGQEALIMGAAGGYQPGEQYTSDETLSRLLNSFVAGAVVGGSIGGLTNLAKGEPTDLLTAKPTEAAPTPAGGLTPEQQQIENLRKTFNVPAPDLFGGFLPTQTPPPDLSRTTTVLPTPPPSPEVQLPFAFGPQPQPPSAPTPAAPTPAAPTPAAPTPAAPTPAAPTPSAVERVGDNFIRFGTARIEVTDKGIGFQAPGVPSTLFYPDKGVFGDRRGEGRVSQMDERGVPKELQPIFRDYLAGRISKLDLDTIVTRLREVETNFQTPRQGIAAPTPEVPAPTAAEVREEIKALPNAQRRVLVAEYGNNTKLTQAIKSNPATVKGSLDAVKARQVPEGGQPERIGAGPQVQEVREDRNVQAVVAPGGPEAGRGDITPEGGQVAGAVTEPVVSLVNQIASGTAPPPTATELRELIKKTRERELELATTAFGGDRAKAEKFFRLLRTADTAGGAVADKAIDDLSALRNEVSPEAEAIWERESGRLEDVDGLRALASVYQDLENAPEDIPAILRPYLPDLGNKVREPFAKAVLAKTAEVIKESGLDSAATMQRILDSYARQFSDPEDAAFMLGQLEQYFQARRRPKAPQIPPREPAAARAVTPPPLSAEAKISNVPYFQQAQQTQPALARVITTDNVRAVGAFDPRYTGYIAGLLKATGLGKRRVIVINADELASIDNLSAPNFNIAASEFNDVKAAINDAKTIFQSGVTKGLAMMTNSGIGIIVRSPSTKGLFGITIAAHEVGHLVKWIAVHSAPWSTQVKLLEAHKKHLDNLLKTNPAGVPPSLKTFVESMRATPQARGEARLAPEFYANTLMAALRISDPAYFNYITSFDEWFADQVARWATTQKKPLTVLEKFFSNLGRRLKALFDAGRKEGLPDPDVKTFLDGLENAPIGPSVLVATMQGLPAQTPLTAAAAAAKPTPVEDTRDMPTRIEDFVRRNLSNFPESLQNTASRTAINLYTLGQKGVYGMSFGRDLIDLFAKALPSANAYFDIVVRRATEARILQQEVDKIMERTGGLSLEVRRDLNKFLADSTSKQQWGYQPTWRTDTVQIDPDMAVQYNTLKTKSPEAATVADEIFKYSYQTRNALRNAINTEIEGELTTAQFNKLSPEEQAQRREDAARRLRLLDTTLQNLKGPYAPLSRFGPYAVVAKSKEYLALQKIPYLERSKEERDRLQELKSNPDHYIVQFVSSAGEAQLTKSQLAKQFPSMEVESFERKVLTSELETMPWANLLRLKSVVATQFGADSKANANQTELINRLLTDMYISALAENSARKHNLPRATVAGFEQDMLKSFVTKGKSDAHFLAAIKTGTDTTEVLEQLGKEAKMSDAEVLEYNKTVPSERQVSGSRLERSQAFNELLLRHVSGMTYNPTPFQDAVLQFNSVWMLLSVPRYYIQNALQTYMVSLPVMAAKFGYGKSSSAITETYQELIKSMDGKWADFLSGKFDVDQMRTKDGKKYPDAELQFLKDMRDSGRIDIGLGYDLGHWESFSETAPIRKLNDTVHKMVSLTRQVEIANRITAGMAAYRLAKASGMSEFDARSYAAQVLDQTQGDYSGFNAPRFFSSVPFGKFVFQFRKYQILQLSLLARNTYLMFKGATKEDRRLGRLVLRNVLGQTALATGALGLPITGIAYVLAAAFGEEEEPVDAERFLRSYLTDDYNLADFILKGIPAGLGVDVSAQFGFNTVFSILPYTDVDFTSREGFAKTLLGIGGPVMGTAANVADGFGYFSRGDYQKGFEMMLPNGLKHAMRAYRETFSDGVTRKNGDLVMSPDEFNFMQGILQGLGFSTTEVQRIRRTRQDLYEFETYFSNRTTQIRRDYVEARKSGDVEGMQEAKAAWLALQQSKKRVNFKPSPLLNLYSAPAEQRKREQRYQEQYRGLRE